MGNFQDSIELFDSKYSSLPKTKKIEIPNDFSAIKNTILNMIANTITKTESNSELCILVTNFSERYEIMTLHHGFMPWFFFNSVIQICNDKIFSIFCSITADR